MGYAGYSVFNILASIVPNLLNGLTGGLTGAAVKVLADVGIKLPETDNPEAELERIVASADPELLAKLRGADNDFKLQMQKLKLDLTKLGNESTEGARQMHIKLGGHLVPYMGVFILLVGFVAVFCLFFVEFPAANRDLINIFLALIVGYGGNVVTFYFGSSDEGGRAKGVDG